MYSQSVRRASQIESSAYHLAHLAVYPFKVHYRNQTSVEHLVFLEKGQQVIGVNGPSPISLPSQNANFSQPILNQEWIIPFRVVNPSAVYQWVLYQQASNGSMNVVDKAHISMEEVLKTISLPSTMLKGSTVGSKIVSKISGAVTHHQYQSTFSKAGIKLHYVVVIGEDSLRLQQHIKMLYLAPPPPQPPEQSLNSKQLQMPAMLRVISAEGERGGERDYFVSSLAPSNRSQYSKVKHKSSLDTNQLLRDPFNRDVSKFTVRSGALVSESDKNPSSYDLDDLILNRKEKDKKNEETVEVNISKPKYVQQIPEVKQDSDLVFGVEEPKAQQQVSEKTDKLVEEPTDRTMAKGQTRDYGMLKLDSDNVQKEPIDLKLEMEELSAIQQDLNSARSSLFVPTEIKKESSQHSHHSSPSHSPSTKLQQIDEKSEKSVVSHVSQAVPKSSLPYGVSFKQITLLAVALILALLLGASMASTGTKRKSKSRRRVR